ncbi:MAG TPA: hypothetical protein VMT85_04345 [Thermoanaerobaculia bacterium]|nr:hypothetical protein [Thermoanaerobaculia bacterium]
MIDEAMGKILGMAMAYGVSVLGLFLAYVNYRKRIVKAERVMTTTAWAVVAVAVLAVAGGVLVVSRLAGAAVETGVGPIELEQPEQVEIEVEAPAPPGSSLADAPPAESTRRQWSWIGIIVPATIFLVATVVTAALHRHFSAQPPGAGG